MHLMTSSLLYHRLYDPCNSELKMLLHNGTFFPSEQFSDPRILETLIMLGLRQTLGVDGLLDVARSVSMLYDSSEAIELARRMLSSLNALTLKLSYEEEKGHSSDTMESENTFPGSEEELVTHVSANTLPNSLTIDSVVNNLLDDVSGDEFWSTVKSIDWCPVYSDPPGHGIPWLDSQCKIAAPTATRPKSQMWIVSSHMHILDGECSDILQRKLGWVDPPGVDTLAAQLVGLSNGYNEIRLHHDTELKKQIPLIYSHLQNYIKNCDDLDFLRTCFEGVRWVWIGDDFVSPYVLAFDSPVKFSPYMYVVPSELSIFQDLLLALGVRQTFCVSDYISVLQRLHDDVKAASLSTDQLNFVHCVLETISDDYLNELGIGNSTMLLIPDSTGVLVSAEDLVYNDAPWIESNSLVGKRFVHSSISYQLASKLGIQSLRSLSLVSKELTKDLPCMDYDKICELLELHGNYEFLLFDLLELADCCRAKKLHFIFDKREHPRQFLLQHNLGNHCWIWYLTCNLIIYYIGNFFCYSCL